MVKAYLRYVFDDVVGLLCTNNCNITFDQKNRYLITSANQYIFLINLKTGEVQHKLFKPGKNDEIVHLSLPNKSSTNILAAGYSDGEVIIWDLKELSQRNCLNGHKAPITSIKFSEDDSVIYSASEDTTIIVWDIISDTALYKLKGHKNAVTNIEPVLLVTENMVKYDLLLSSGKDGIFKIWDLSLTSSIETISTKSTEIWDFIYNKIDKLALIALNNDEILIIRLGLKVDPITKQKQFFEELGRFKRASFARVLSMQFDWVNNLLFLLS